MTLCTLLLCFLDIQSSPLHQNFSLAMFISWFQSRFCLQIRLMKLSEFQEKHEGDLTGPALEEIKIRQQALKAQLMPPPATGKHIFGSAASILVEEQNLIQSNLSTCSAQGLAASLIVSSLSALALRAHFCNSFSASFGMSFSASFGMSFSASFGMIKGSMCTYKMFWSCMFMANDPGSILASIPGKCQVNDVKCSHSILPCCAG